MNVRADVRFGGIDALIEAAAGVASPEQIKREAEAAAPEVKRLYEEGFNLSESPEGETWAPQKHDYGHPLMRDTYALWSSAEVESLSDGIRISTGIEYAEYLHEGTKNMEARRLVPVFVLGPRWENGIARARLSVPPRLP